MLAGASKVIRVVVELNEECIRSLCEGKTLTRFAKISKDDELENDVIVEVYSTDHYMDED